MSNSTETNSNAGPEAYMEKVRVFLITFPCILLFSFVFICYLCIRRHQRLHGWIVLSITASLAVRFTVLFLIYFPHLYRGWAPYDVPAICAALGKYSLSLNCSTSPSRFHPQLVLFKKLEL